MQKLLRVAAALTIGLLLLSGCGGDEGDGESALQGTLACDGAPLNSSEIKLPADFPIPSAAVFTSSETAGPSSVTEGFFEGSVQTAYAEWKEAIADADYDILFDELEEFDSEISYKSADGDTTGQIAMRAECKDADKIFVHITNRPA